MDQQNNQPASSQPVNINELVICCAYCQQEHSPLDIEKCRLNCYETMSHFSGLLSDMADKRNKLRDQLATVTAERDKLKQLLEDVDEEVSASPELCPCNYSDDQVCELNAAMMNVATLLSNHFEPTDQQFIDDMNVPKTVMEAGDKHRFTESRLVNNLPTDQQQAEREVE